MCLHWYPGNNWLYAGKRPGKFWKPNEAFFHSEIQSPKDREWLSSCLVVINSVFQVDLSTLQNGSGCWHSLKVAGTYYNRHFTDWETDHTELVTYPRPCKMSRLGLKRQLALVTIISLSFCHGRLGLVV